MAIGGVNGKEVGGGAKGCPTYANVLSGAVKLKYKFFKQHFGDSLTMGLVGALTGGLGAAVVLEAQDKEEEKDTKIFTVERVTYIS